MASSASPFGSSGQAKTASSSNPNSTPWQTKSTSTSQLLSGWFVGGRGGCGSSWICVTWSEAGSASLMPWLAKAPSAAS